MTGPTPTDLICNRLADMTKMHPEQIVRLCHKCNQQVGVYPSGQRALKLFPRMKITCVTCIEMTPRELVEDAFPAGSADEIIQETRESYDVTPERKRVQ